MQQKEAELVLSRLKNEKKISKVINVMNTKNDQIENYIREKKYFINRVISLMRFILESFLYEVIK
jgi:hypothetical protein